MRKVSLDDLKNQTRKEPYEVPQGYFDRLPMQINDRVLDQMKPKRSFVFSPALRLATSVLTLLLVAVLWFKPFNFSGDSTDNYYTGFEDQLYWTIVTSNLSIEEFFYYEDMRGEIMDEILYEELGSFGGGYLFDYNPDWDDFDDE